MKKITLAALAALVVLISCSKDKDKDASVSERILGKWKLEKIDSREVFDGTDTSFTYTGVEEDHMTFNADGKGVFYYDGEADNITYKIQGDTAILVTVEYFPDANLFKIEKLTASELVLYAKQDLSLGYTSDRVFLKR